MKASILIVTMALTLMVLSTPARALDSTAGSLTVTRIADRLDEPWAIGFLPDGSALVTEKRGRLYRITDQGRTRIRGVGPVVDRGQGGLLDVLVPRDFATSRTLFFTLSKKQRGGAGTAVARAQLVPGSQTLTNWQVIFEIAPGSSGGRHFGSRLVEAPDGTLFVTVGDRGDRPSAQDVTRENGSVLRITKTGGIPAGNPFTTRPNARPAIWSYGHRNPQGAALDGQGRLWVVEHGAKGGDEVNRITKGANYGWPVISYGRHYSGEKIGEGTAKPGLEQPQHYWDPSIAPSGMMIYSGKLWPQWRGHIFIGALKLDFISRLSGAPLREAERLKSSETARVRDVREAPDGSIWFLSVDRGALYRITP